MDADRIIFTLGGYIFGKCGQEGRQVPVVVLRLLGLHGPESLQHDLHGLKSNTGGDVVEVRITNS